MRGVVPAIGQDGRARKSLALKFAPPQDEAVAGAGAAGGAGAGAGGRAVTADARCIAAAGCTRQARSSAIGGRPTVQEHRAVNRCRVLDQLEAALRRAGFERQFTSGFERQFTSQQAELSSRCGDSAVGTHRRVVEHDWICGWARKREDIDGGVGVGVLVGVLVAIGRTTSEGGRRSSHHRPESDARGASQLVALHG